MSNPRVYEIAFHLAGRVSSSMRNSFQSAQRQLSQLEERTRGVRQSMGQLSVTSLKVAGALSAVTNGLGGITAAAAPAIAGAGALASTFVAAGAGAAAYGLVASSAINKVVEASGEVEKIQEKIQNADSAKARIKAQKELAALYADMSKEQQGALKNLQSFQSFWGDFVQGFEKPVFQAFSQSLVIAKKALEAFKVPIQNVATVVNQTLSKVNESFSNGELTGVFNWLNKSASSSLSALLTTAGQTTKGILNLFVAFAPLTQSVENGMVGMTRAFAQWSAGLSKSEGFQTFIEYAKQNTPTLLNILSNLGGIVFGVIKQVAPLGPAVLKGLEVLTGLIDKALNAGIAIKSFGQIIQEAVSGSSSNFQQLRSMVSSVLQNIAPVFKGVASQVGGLLSSIGSKAVQAFAGLHAFWQQNGPAIVAAVSNVFNIIGTVIGGVISVVRTIFSVLEPVFNNIGSFIMGIAQQIISFWQTDGAQIMKAVQNVFAGINAVIKFLSPVILFVVNMVWGSVKGVIQGALKVIMGVIRIFAGLFTGDFGKMWQGVKQLFVGALQFIWNLMTLIIVGRLVQLVKTGITGIITHFQYLWALGKDIFRRLWDDVARFFVNGARNAISHVQNLWNQARSIFSMLRQFGEGIFRALWNTIRSVVSNIASNVRQGFTAMKDRATGLIDTLKTNIVNRFTQIVDAAKQLPGKIGNGIKSMAGKALDGVRSMGNKLLTGIGKIVNGVVNGLNSIMGEKGLNIGLKIKTWDVPQYANGTFGHPGGPAILGDGKGSNSGPELFRTRQGHVGLSPATNTLMNLPKGTQVINARDTRQILNTIPAYNKGNVFTNAVQTGQSWVSTGVSKVKEVASTVKDKALDIWSYISNPSKLLEVLMNKYGAVVPNMSGVFGKMATGAFKLVKDKALGFLKGKLEGFGGSWNGKIPNNAQVKAWVTQALAITNTPMSWLPAMMVKAQKESGFNPRAINLWDINAKRGIPSKGLFQTIDPTFNAYKMAGMNDIYNPVHNAVAAIRYIKARYGTVFNTPGIKAMARGGAYKGYYKGGNVPNTQWAWVGEHGPELMKIPGGSRVYNNGQSNSMISGLLSYLRPQGGSAPAAKGKGSLSSDQYVFSPQITVQGNADASAMDALNAQMLQQFEVFKQWVIEREDEKKRKSNLAYG